MGLPLFCFFFNLYYKCQYITNLNKIQNNLFFRLYPLKWSRSNFKPMGPPSTQLLLLQLDFSSQQNQVPSEKRSHVWN